MIIQLTERQKHTYLKWGIGLIIALFSIFLFHLNTLVPYLPGDDMLYQLKMPDKGIVGSERISSLSDLVESQKNFYNNYHYRVLNHTVLQVLLLLPPWIFDALNTLVFLLLPLCLLRINTENKDYWLKYVSLLFFIWIFHFNLGRSYFLTTGALNYSWLLIPQLLYLSELCRWLEYRENKNLLIGLALLNVNANENALVVMFALTAVVFLLARRRVVERSDWPLLLSAVILLAGGFFMLASPSLDARLDEQGFRAGGWMSHAIEYGSRTVFYLFNYLPVLLLAWVWKANWRGGGRKSWGRKNVLLLIGVWGSLAVMVGVPLFEPRSAVFGFFVGLMVVISMAKDSAVGGKGMGVLILMGVAVCIVRYPAFQQALQRYEHNLTLLKSEEQVVELDPYCDRTRRTYLLCHQLSTDPAFIDNRSLAAVYGKKEVSLKNPRREEIKTLEGFNKVNKRLWIKRTGTNKFQILFKEQKPNKKYIIRGSRSSHLKHYVLNFIFPERLRIQFLDFLEDVTVTTQEQIEIASDKYYRLDQNLVGGYDYLLVSEYDRAKHRRVGEIFRVGVGE